MMFSEGQQLFCEKPAVGRETFAARRIFARPNAFVDVDADDNRWIGVVIVDQPVHGGGDSPEIKKNLRRPGSK